MEANLVSAIRERAAIYVRPGSRDDMASQALECLGYCAAKQYAHVTFREENAGPQEVYRLVYRVMRGDFRVVVVSSLDRLSLNPDTVEEIRGILHHVGARIEAVRASSNEPVPLASEPERALFLVDSMGLLRFGQGRHESALVLEHPDVVAWMRSVQFPYATKRALRQFRILGDLGNAPENDADQRDF